jgi:Rad3-related DNA helicase
MVAIATEIKVVPRPAQLAIIFLLLTSIATRSLIQLVTGFGKSLMLGLMARYLNLIHNKKVVVVVPNEVLAAI